MRAFLILFVAGLISTVSASYVLSPRQIPGYPGLCHFLSQLSLLQLTSLGSMCTGLLAQRYVQQLSTRGSPLPVSGLTVHQLDHDMLPK